MLGLVAAAPWAESLVLRGSMTMASWVGDAARPPGDLDWVVWAPDAVSIEALDPYPHLERRDLVSPEAGRPHEIWTFQDPDPERDARAARDGSRDTYETMHEQLTALVARHPRTVEGVILDAGGVSCQRLDGYAYASSADGAQSRMLIPWVTPGGEAGDLRMDLAYDEVMLDRAVHTPVRRAGGHAPVTVRTASRELSLAWKLHWLTVDQAVSGVSAMKDVYDAVLLAELDGIELSRRLRRMVRAADEAEPLLRPANIARWTIDGDPPGGDPAPWLARLGAAADRLVWTS
ncbi:hypothetical protein GCM10025331_00380 [Actinoplanes utahensis]